MKVLDEFSCRGDEGKARRTTESYLYPRSDSLTLNPDDITPVPLLGVTKKKHSLNTITASIQSQPQYNHSLSHPLSYQSTLNPDLRIEHDSQMTK